VKLGGVNRALRKGLALLGLIWVVAVLGYVLAGWSWLDAMYMVVTTLSTVGYSEVGEMTPGLRVFNMVVILFGVSTALYVGGGFVHMVLEGEVNRALGLRRATKEIERLRDHVVLCGFGRTGETVAGELKRAGKALVVVDNDPQQAAEAQSQGYLTIHDDASEEDTLLAAGVARATALVTTLPSDAQNVFITLTARNLHPKLQIIARGERRSTEKKLIQAGADRVVLPAAAGGLRMAAMITRPSTLDLIELASGGRIAEMIMEELTVPPESTLVGATVGNSQTRSRFGLLVVAIRRADGRLLFNPGVDADFRAGDAVIVMGKVEDVERFRAEHHVA
jgi:voltage-gated potassium channel